MNGQFKVSQASGTGNSNNAAPPRIFKLTKPHADQSVVIKLGDDQKVQVDFSAIANEKIALVHIGEKLMVLFDNQSTVTVEPFFESRHDALGNLTIEVAPGRDLTVSEFASTFSVTTDASVLPAAGTDGNAQASGGNFLNPLVDPLPPIPTNILAPPEVLPPIDFTIVTGPVLPPNPPPSPVIPVVTHPAFATTKDVSSVTLVGAEGETGNIADAQGAVIHYNIVLTNTGDVALTGVHLSDPSPDATLHDPSPR